MNADRLLTLYDRVAEAPDAIARLRRFVLDLAVRGKLVEQDPADEPAAELLKRIAAEKAQLERGKKIKSSKVVPILPEQCPFEIPQSWSLVPLGEALVLINGRAFKPTDWTEKGLQIVRIQNLNKPLAPFNRFNGEVKEKFLIDDGDFLISWSGTPGTSFGAHIWDRGPAIVNQHIYKSILLGGVFEKRFLKVAINARLLELIERAHGGVGLQHITKPKLEAVAITLPPFAEQQRIAAKVDELMELCERLEKARAAREETRDRLTKASLACLSAPHSDDVAFRAHARIVVDGLPALTARAVQVKHLRQTILDLAVRGQLVEKIENDGEAASLMELILAEKRQAIQRNIVPDLTLVDFVLPSHWSWHSLDDVIIGGPQNGISPRKTNRADAPKAITLTATTSGSFDVNQFKHVDIDRKDAQSYWLEPGDLLFQRGNTRDYVGMTAIYNGPPNRFLFPDLIMRVKVSPRMNLHFVHLWCIAPFVRHYLSSNATGAQKTMPKINQGTLRATPIAVPPLAEQHRIVAKVDELTALCDRLKDSLAAADTARSNLLEVILSDTPSSAQGA